jgi:hypothetical protein
MKKALIAGLWSFGLAALCQAQGITTDYTKGYFVTRAEATVHAAYSKAALVIEKFIQQYNHDPNGLFRWALVGMKLHGEQDDFIMFNIKTHTLENNYVSGVMDLDVPPLSKKNKDVAYKVRIYKEEVAGKGLVLRYEMVECEKVIEHAVAQLSIAQESNHDATLHFEAKVKMGLPYSMMTKKQYRENIEWRFARLLENLGNEMQK